MRSREEVSVRVRPGLVALNCDPEGKASKAECKGKFPTVPPHKEEVLSDSKISFAEFERMLAEGGRPKKLPEKRAVSTKIRPTSPQVEERLTGVPRSAWRPKRNGENSAISDGKISMIEFPRRAEIKKHHALVVLRAQAMTRRRCRRSRGRVLWLPPAEAALHLAPATAPQKGHSIPRMSSAYSARSLDSSALVKGTDFPLPA